MFAIIATTHLLTKIRVTQTSIYYDTHNGEGYFTFTNGANLTHVINALRVLAKSSGKAHTEYNLVTRIFSIETKANKQIIAEFAFNGE